MSIKNFVKWKKVKTSIKQNFELLSLLEVDWNKNINLHLNWIKYRKRWKNESTHWLFAVHCIVNFSFDCNEPFFDTGAIFKEKYVTIAIVACSLSCTFTCMFGWSLSTHTHRYKLIFFIIFFCHSLLRFQHQQHYISVFSFSFFDILIFCIRLLLYFLFFFFWSRKEFFDHSKSNVREMVLSFYWSLLIALTF